MWKIKGCRGGVGVVLEDVVAWSVGPVPTKHLISLIKRTLAWYVLNSGDSGHVPSLHSPPLSHTHPDAAISHSNMRNKREKANSGQILKTFLPCDPAKTRQETVFEAQQRLTVKDVSAVTDYRLSCLSSQSEKHIQSPLDRVPWVLKWVIFGNSWKENQSFGALLYIWIKLMYVEGLPGLNALHIAGACKHICTVS